MNTLRRRPSRMPRALAKCPTGIPGLDDITGGGLPRGRTSLVCGGPGCGKTLLAVEFLVRGAAELGEPGVLVSFEETPAELAQNVRSLGFDLDALVAARKLVVDHVRVERGEHDVVGEYDLEGLFVRLGYAIDTVGAKRVVLDTIEALFAGMSDHALLRSELRRLFRWLKDKGVTSILTAERGDGALTRNGLEEHVSDCVILLDHRVVEQVSTRRMRIVKYRGTSHGSNEYPFLIDEHGISVLPITALGLAHAAPTQRLLTGVERVDTMLGGKGIYRGSTLLISGTPGSGKSSLAAHVAAESCRRRERCLVFAFEESPSEIVRNMRSIGLDLAPFLEKKLLLIAAARPAIGDVEMHLAGMHRRIREFDPKMVVVDPISNFDATGSRQDSASLLLRLIDLLKSRAITSVLTHLTNAREIDQNTSLGISSIIDTWILLRDIESGGERNRGLCVLKARGMAHSNQIRELIISDRGLDLRDVYLGSDGVLAGTMRDAQEARERLERERSRERGETERRAFERKAKALEAQIAMLHAELEAERSAFDAAGRDREQDARRSGEERDAIGRTRGADRDERTPARAGGGRS